MLVVDKVVSDIDVLETIGKVFGEEGGATVAFTKYDDVGNGRFWPQDVDPEFRRFVSHHFLPGVGTFLRRRMTESHPIVNGFGW